ncbi:MAG: hypothetical protein PHS77_10420 [Gallionellaceae bacterium]|nr:hypothetical protein [Gallionellaceae bacterium]
MAKHCNVSFYGRLGNKAKVLGSSGCGFELVLMCKKQDTSVYIQGASAEGLGHENLLWRG